MILHRYPISISLALACVGLATLLFPMAVKGQGSISATEVAEVLYQKLEHFYDTGSNPDSVKLWIDELAGLAQGPTNSLAEAHLHRFRGEKHLVGFQADSALIYFNAALRRYQHEASAYQVQRLYLSLADVHFEIGKYQVCDSLLTLVKTYAEKESLPFLKGKVSYIEGGVFSRQGNCQASVDAMDEASDWFEQSGHQKWQNMARAEAAACLVDLGKFEESIARYLESAKYYEEQGEWRNVGIRYINIGTVFYEMGRHEEAIDYGYRAYAALPTSFKYGQAHAYNLLGISFQELAALDSAVKYFSKILDIDQNGALQNDYLLAIVLSNLAEALSGMGQSREALQYVNRT